MRILHILDHSIPLHSGYTFRTLSILRQQRAMGWRTIHMTGPKQGKVDPPDRNNDEWHFFRTKPGNELWSGWPLLRHLSVVNAMARRLHHVIKLTRPDILHAHSPALNALAALRVGRSLQIPVVYEIRAFWEDAAVDHGTSTEGGLRYRLSQSVETFAARRADAVTTICEGLREQIELRGICPKKITVIPNAVNIRHFNADHPRDFDLARRLGLGWPTLGFIGSFYAYEGLELLIEALPALRRAHQSLRVLLVGGGPHEEQLRRRAAELGVANEVIFTGRIDHERIADYYAQIDILVYPRLPMRLTELVTPLKPLEAMAQGCLVLASDVGGHRELIDNGRTGMLFEAGSAAALAEAALALLGEPLCWPAMRRSARGFVETERTWESSVARYAPLYRRLLERRPLR